MSLRKISINAALQNPVMPDGKFTPEFIRLLTEIVSDRRISAGPRQPVIISSGSVELIPGFSYYAVDTEGGGASDDLDTVTNGNEGDIVFIEAANAARTVVIRDGAGNILTNGGANLTLDNSEDIAMLIFDGLNWKADLWNISS